MDLRDRSSSLSGGDLSVSGSSWELWLLDLTIPDLGDSWNNALWNVGGLSDWSLSGLSLDDWGLLSLSVDNWGLSSLSLSDWSLLSLSVDNWGLLSLGLSDWGSLSLGRNNWSLLSLGLSDWGLLSLSLNDWSSLSLSRDNWGLLSLGLNDWSLLSLGLSDWGLLLHGDSNWSGVGVDTDDNSWRVDSLQTSSWDALNDGVVGLLDLTIPDLSNSWDTVQVANVGLLQSDGLVLDSGALHSLDVGVDLLVRLSVGLSDLVDSHAGLDVSDSLSGGDIDIVGSSEGLSDIVGSSEGLSELVSSGGGDIDVVGSGEGLWLSQGLNGSRDLSVNLGVSLSDSILTGGGLSDIESSGAGLSLSQGLSADLRLNSVGHTVSDRRSNSGVTGGNQAVVLSLIGAWDGSGSVSVGTVEGDGGVSAWDGDGGVSNDLSSSLSLLTGNDLSDDVLSWVEG